MKIGAAKVEITPPLGLELSGFALRPQPATAALDSLWIRGLYCEQGGERFLWLHADVLAVGQLLVERLQGGIAAETGLPRDRILISAIHTHSGPAVIQLTACGQVDSDYVARFESQCKEAARMTLRNLEECELVSAEAQCGMAINRRKSGPPHTDPTVGLLGWRRRDGTFKAAWLNYAMHPVCLRGSEISGDWPGEAARVLSEQLPGQPIVMVACGACGNINPPAVGVTSDEMRGWGKKVAETVVGRLSAGDAVAIRDPGFAIHSRNVRLPEEEWDICQVEEYAERCLMDPAGERAFGHRFKRAVEIWRETMVARRKSGAPYFIDGKLSAISFGPVAILTVNAEVFSQFTSVANPNDGRSVYVTGCANGMLGYLAPKDAYAEGGYEISWAMLFYNLPRPQKGAFELLAENARELLAVSATPPV